MATEFALTDRFFIDDGELDGVSVGDAFVLGVEFWMVRCELRTDRAAFERPIHPANAERLKRLCWSYRRGSRTEHLANGWATLFVDAPETVGGNRDGEATDEGPELGCVHPVRPDHVPAPRALWES